MNSHSFLRKLSELSFKRKLLNNSIVQIKYSWDEIYKIINTKDCCKEHKK